METGVCGLHSKGEAEVDHVAVPAKRISTEVDEVERKQKVKHPLHRSRRGVVTWGERPRHVSKGIANLLDKQTSIQAGGNALHG